MKLTQEEKNKLISAKDETEWYEICEDIKKTWAGKFRVIKSNLSASG